MSCISAAGEDRGQLYQSCLICDKPADNDRNALQQAITDYITVEMMLSSILESSQLHCVKQYSYICEVCLKMLKHIHALDSQSSALKSYVRRKFSKGVQLNPSAYQNDKGAYAAHSKTYLVDTVCDEDVRKITLPLVYMDICLDKNTQTTPELVNGCQETVDTETKNHSLSDKISSGDAPSKNASSGTPEPAVEVVILPMQEKPSKRGRRVSTDRSQHVFSTSAVYPYAEAPADVDPALEPLPPNGAEPSEAAPAGRTLRRRRRVPRAEPRSKPAAARGDPGLVLGNGSGSRAKPSDSVECGERVVYERPGSDGECADVPGSEVKFVPAPAVVPGAWSSSPFMTSEKEGNADADGEVCKWKGGYGSQQIDCTVFGEESNIRLGKLEESDDERVRCDACGKAFSDISALKHHREGCQCISNPDPLADAVENDGVANEPFDDLEDADSGEVVWTCPVWQCGRVYRLLPQLKRHTRQHKIATKDISLCLKCGAVFSSPAALAVHMQKLHVDPASTSVIVICGVCGMGFRDSAAHDRHTATHLVPCNICHKQLRKDSLREHMRRHTGETRYVCDLCGRRFVAFSSLRAHKRAHTGDKPHKCHLCAQMFHRKDSLAAHLECHEGKPFSCDECGMEFASSRKLAAHKRTHDKRSHQHHTCETCGEGFMRLRSLKHHRLKHVGQLPYTCDICQKGFTYQDAYREHVNVHTGERPFTCEVCGKSFGRRSCLWSHRSLHAPRRMTCQLCGKRFSNLSSFAAHQRQHADGERHRCADCGRSFRLQTELKNHACEPPAPVEPERQAEYGDQAERGAALQQLSLMSSEPGSLVVETADTLLSLQHPVQHVQLSVRLPPADAADRAGAVQAALSQSVVVAPGYMPQCFALAPPPPHADDDSPAAGQQHGSLSSLSVPEPVLTTPAAPLLSSVPPEPAVESSAVQAAR